MADERRHLMDEGFCRQLLDAGMFVNDIAGRFTNGWGVHPVEVIPWFEHFGLQTLDLVSSEGMAAGIETSFAEMRESDPAAFAAAVQLVVDTATDPSILGLASYLLYVARAV